MAGVSWHPEVASGAMTAAEVEATFARTHELLGADIEAEHHRLDAAQCVYLGRDPTDRAFARTLGFTFQDAARARGRAADPVQ